MEGQGWNVHLLDCSQVGSSLVESSPVKVNWWKFKVGFEIPSGLGVIFPRG